MTIDQYWQNFHQKMRAIPRKFWFLLLAPVFISCSDVEYTKGYPFWNYDWSDSELMAVYQSKDREYEYKKYFNVKDTVIEKKTGKNFYDLKYLTYRFTDGRISGQVWSRNKILINKKIVEFPTLE